MVGDAAPATDSTAKADRASHDDARLDAVVEFVAKLAQDVDDIREKLKPTLARYEAASAKIERLLTDDAVGSVNQRAADITEAYQSVWSMISTFEMVIYAVSRSEVLKKKIDPGVAAVKLVRLMGFGADYFHKRNHWSIDNWVEHLSACNEYDTPGNIGYETTPVAEHKADGRGAF